MTDRVRFVVRVTARAGADAVDGVNESGELRVRVRAAPVSGEANQAVLGTVAAALGTAPSRLRIERGGTGRVKLIATDAISATALEARWPGLALGHRSG